jgi:hypothetical protein
MVVWADANQTISATTWTTVEFDTVIEDRGGWYDTTNYEWTPTHSGLYLISMNLRFIDEEYWIIRLYDVTGTAQLIETERIAGDDDRTGFWHLQWWCEGGNTYSIDVYTSTASELYSDTYGMVTGPIMAGSQ